MQAGVVPAYHHYVIKEKVLRAQLLDRYKLDLQNADSKERKRIMKEIDAQIAQALKKFPNRLEIDPNWIIR